MKSKIAQRIIDRTPDSVIEKVKKTADEIVNRKYKFEGTNTEWSIPHLSSPEIDCNCGFVFEMESEDTICTVHYRKEDANWRDGEYPYLREAMYNGKLIGNALNLFNLIQKYRETTDEFAEETDELLKSICEI